MTRKRDRLKILVIDDEIHMRFYLMTLVKSMGLEPVLAKDGIQGLDILADIKPAAIILDIMMPRKGGSLVYREILTRPELKNIPVVFFSGVDRRAFLHYIKMLNANLEQGIPEPEYYVTKDADPEYLKDVIEKCISKNALESQ